jgi:hypothetical protein
VSVFPSIAFEIVGVLKIAQTLGRERTEPIKLGFFLRDLLQKFVHDSF